ncbi:protein ACCELERATED CELL DEATH 6-like [Senna tora]|uniref:Protein ACCELERATED CELL DEATH 6-like n=1 Tax=Senna tora TaxID=362788 RepID=A0A834TKW3_9FABA|nr:protein ACCELERATED CELL DEATH 6-like [Senna tora]
MFKGRRVEVEERLNVEQIPMEANDDGGSWRQRCKERMERLKNKQQLAARDNGVIGKEMVIFDLHEAVQIGDVDLFVGVLEKITSEMELCVSAIFDLVTHAGDSLLHIAAAFGKEKIVELIAYHYPKLLTKKNIKGDTALHVAARAGNVDVMNVILLENSRFGWNEELTRLRNQFGNTALHEGVLRNDVSGVRMLLEVDTAVIHYRNKSGRSPLYLAAVAGDVNIIRLLLQTPFPVEDPCLHSHGNSPLHAAILQHNPGTIEMIVEIEPKLMHVRDEEGRTPLHYAAYTGYVEAVRILKNKCALAAFQRNKNGHIPIHLACQRGHVQAVKELLQLIKWHNVKDLVNQKGQNILHIAAMNGRNNVIKYLLESPKIDQSTINERDNDGNTALHLAAKGFYLRTLSFLSRDKRIDVNLVNNEGLTPRDIIWLHSKIPRTRTEFLADMILESAGVPLKAKDMSCVQRKVSTNTEWNVKDATNTLLVVAVLIITVTFAASITVPGGVHSSDDPDPHKRGKAILGHHTLFQVFMAFNMVAMCSATIGCLILLWVQLGDRRLAQGVYEFAKQFVNLALITLTVSFLAASRLVVTDNLLLSNVVSVIGLIFVLSMLFVGVLGKFPLGLRLPILRQAGELLIGIILVLFYGRQDRMIDEEHKDSDYNSHEAGMDSDTDIDIDTMREIYSATCFSEY